MDFQKFGVRSIEDIEPYDVSSVMHYGPTVSKCSNYISTVSSNCNDGNFIMNALKKLI